MSMSAGGFIVRLALAGLLILVMVVVVSLMNYDRTARSGGSSGEQCPRSLFSFDIPGVPLNAVGNDDHLYWKDPDAWNKEHYCNANGGTDAN